MRTRRYISTGKPGFSIWRRFYITVILVAFIVIISGIQWYAGADPLSGPVLVGLQVAAFIVILRVLSKISVVTMSTIAGERQLEVRSLFGRKRIRGPFKCKRWWNYNFSNSKTFIHPFYTSKRSMNFFYLYCMIEGVNGKVILFEEVQLIQKRVNDKDYNIDGLEKQAKKFKVWNLDRCLRRIGLDEVCGE